MTSWQFSNSNRGFKGGFTRALIYVTAECSVLSAHKMWVQHKMRLLLELMDVCHCCVLPLSAFPFCPSFDSSFRCFLNLDFTMRKDGQITGFYCLAARFYNYNFSPLPTMRSTVCTECMYVRTNYITAVSHSAFAKRSWHTEVTHKSARVNPPLCYSVFKN